MHKFGLNTDKERKVNMLLSSVQRINAGLVSTCFIGIALSYYAYFVETSKEQDDSYEAMCDISEHVSCTKAFMSKYGKGFGIIPETSALYLPNSVYGLSSYTAVALLSISNSYIATVAVLILGVLSNLASVYLAFVLYILQDVCVICVSTYLVNAVNVFFAVHKYGIIASRGSPKKRKSN